MKNPTKTVLALLAVALLGCGLFSTSANAATINGALGITGIAVFNGDVNTATAISSFPLAVTTVGFGDYTGVPGGTVVSMNGFTFDPTGSGVTPLWTFTIGPDTYSFDLSAVTAFNRDTTTNTISISGNGVAHITGFDSTSGTFTFSANAVTGMIFTFSSATVVTPEGGATVALLGLGFVGIAALRRKLAA